MRRGAVKRNTQLERRKEGLSKINKARIITMVTLLAITSILVTTPITYAAPHTDVSVDTVLNMMTNGTYPNLMILDVRNQSEYSTGYIPKAVLIPLWQLGQRVGELASYKNNDIVVYCTKGPRSHNASVILDAYSFTKVFDMIGGITAWNSSSYPISTPATSYTETAGSFDGAKFVIRVPNNFRGTAWIYCRGYSHDLPTTPLMSQTGAAGLAAAVLPGGAIFAMSDYGSGGYCVRKGMNATYQLTQFVKSTYNVAKVLLVGASMGGNIALLLGEKYPNVYSAVMDMFGAKDLSGLYGLAIDRAATTDDSTLAAKLQALGAPVPPFPFNNTAPPLSNQLQVFRSFCAGFSSDIVAECGGTPDAVPQAYRDIDPLYHTNLLIPVITVHGTSDAIVPYSYSLEYQASVAAAGKSSLYRLYSVVGGQHGDLSTTVASGIRAAELLTWSTQLRPTFRASAFTSVTVLSGWTWWFFAHSTGGVGASTYQWYEGATLLQGQTSMLLSVTKTSPGTYTFFCRATDSDTQAINTNAVTLTVMG